MPRIHLLRPGDRLVLGWPNNEPEFGGLHPLYQVHRRRVLNECWPALAMVVEGIHLNLSPWFLIISWIFRILAHDEDQYTDFFVYSTKTD